jgi:hypothetical protein
MEIDFVPSDPSANNKLALETMRILQVRTPVWKWHLHAFFSLLCAGLDGRRRD